jgi:hypothetical protein
VQNTEKFVFSSTQNSVYNVLRTSFMTLVVLCRSDGYSAEQEIFSVNRTRNVVTALAKVHRLVVLWVIITYLSPSQAFPFQILSYLHIHVLSNPYLFSSFRATCFMYSFPLSVPNARLKIYHRNCFRKWKEKNIWSNTWTAKAWKPDMNSRLLFEYQDSLFSHKY